MNMRDFAKGEAQRLNAQNNKLADLVEKNFDNTPVFIDTVMENDTNDVQILTKDEEGNIVFTTDKDFFILESGTLVPNINGNLAMNDESTLTYVSENRPDILEDIITLVMIAKKTGYKVTNVDKQIEPLDTQDRQLTVVVMTLERLTKVGC